MLTKLFQQPRLVILFCIILLAGFLRFWQLGGIPASLNWDEAAWGYNAYSLGIDGRDEFGRFLPITYLESFGDYKPPMYAYLAVIPVKLFGLTEFATRFPSAFFGTLTVLVTYFLVKRIFYSSEKKENIAIFSTLFLAVSPWHINLSRAAFEANVANFFIVLGIFLFLYALQKKSFWIIGSVICFCLSCYTFNSARIAAPLIFLSLTILLYQQVWKIKREAIVAGIIGVAIMLPLIPFLLSPQAKLRFQEVNIFSDISIIERINQEIKNDDSALWSKLIHNRRFIYGIEYLHHYFDNFSPNFLFISGDENKKFSTQDTGQMYLWDAIFLFIGILFLIKRKEGYWWILPVWLLLAIIPAATARETPHALRIENALPTYQILTAYGLAVVLQFLHNLSVGNKRFIFSMVFFAFIFSVLSYLHGYHFHYSREFSGEWNYGYKESIQYVQRIESNYDYIAVTNQMGRPYIYYLFYTKTNPHIFQKTAIISRDVFGFVKVEGFGKYRFLDRLDSFQEGKVIRIGFYKEIPEKAQIIKDFRLIDGFHILSAYSL